MVIDQGSILLYGCCSMDVNLIDKRLNGWFWMSHKKRSDAYLVNVHFSNFKNYFGNKHFVKNYTEVFCVWLPKIKTRDELYTVDDR